MKPVVYSTWRGAEAELPLCTAGQGEPQHSPSPHSPWPHPLQPLGEQGKEEVKSFSPGGGEELGQAREHGDHAGSLWPGGHFPPPYGLEGGTERAGGTDLNPLLKE